MAEPSKTDPTDLELTERPSIRYSREQMRRVNLAARIVSRRRGQTLEAGTTIRETSMAGVEEIIGGATEEELRIATGDLMESATA